MNFVARCALLSVWCASCAHVPAGPPVVITNTTERLKDGELEYRLRWPEYTRVAVLVSSNAPVDVHCDDCKRSAITNANVPQTKATAGSPARFEFAASARGNTLSISDPDYRYDDGVSVTIELSPRPAEVLSQPRTLEALQAVKERERAEKEAAARRSAEVARGSAEAAEKGRRAAEAETASTTQGGARCKRGEVVSHIVFSQIFRGPVVLFCDGSNAHRLSTGKWTIEGDMGAGWGEASEPVRAAMEVAENNCRVLKTEIWCNRAAVANGEFQRRAAAWAKSHGKPDGWYVAKADAACSTSSKVPGVEACREASVK